MTAADLLHWALAVLASGVAIVAIAGGLRVTVDVISDLWRGLR